MKCSNCNVNIPNGSAKCPVCGYSFQTGGNGGGTYTNKYTGKTTTGGYTGRTGYSGQQPTGKQGTYQGGNVSGDIIVDSSERIIGSLRNSMATSFMVGNGFSKTEVFFTNKRFYAKYKDISMRRGNGNVDAIIDLKEITGTLLRQHNPIYLIVFAVIWVILGFAVASAMIIPAAFIAGLVLAGICIFKWYLERTMMLDISFQGDRINVTLRKCSYENADRFHKELRRYLAQIKNI